MLTGLCLPCVSFESAPMSTPRRQYRDLFSLHREMDGESRLAFFLHPARQPGATAQPRAEPGPPHVVRIRTDIFRRRGKCPRCRVRWGGTGRSFFQNCPCQCPGGAGLRKVCAGVYPGGRKSAAAPGQYSPRADAKTLRARPACPPLAFSGWGCTIPYRERFFVESGENDGATGKRH